VSDERIRELERRAAQGDHDAELALARARLRHAAYFDGNAVAEAEARAGLTGGQLVAFDALEAGASIYLTGSAGTGKSHLLRQWLAHTSRRVAVTASTARCAAALDGQTINRWVGCGLGESTARTIRERFRWDDQHAPAIAAADALIIDEVSMLRGNTFNLIDDLCRLARADEPEDLRRPFGGLQVILVGDIGQLPPVRVEEGGYPFDSFAWRALQPRPIVLEEVMRQADGEFSAALEELRRGRPSSRAIRLLGERVRAFEPGNDCARLYTRNKACDRANARELEKLGDIFEFPAIDFGDQGFLRDCPGRLLVRLAIGARVMTTVNEPDGLYHNGSMGTVIAIADGGALVEFDNGQAVTVTRHEWQQFHKEVAGLVVAEADAGELCRLCKGAAGRRAAAGPFALGAYCLPCWGEQVSAHQTRSLRARRMQLPMVLAWAVTIHKSQGMSLDRVSVNLSRCFAPGQAYVAVSRACSLDGLNIEAWGGADSFTAAPEFLAFLARGYHAELLPADSIERLGKDDLPRPRRRGANDVPVAIDLIDDPRGYGNGGLRATCSLCDRVVEVSGQADKSRRACFAIMRDRCDREGRRFYVQAEEPAAELETT